MKEEMRKTMEIRQRVEKLQSLRQAISASYSEVMEALREDLGKSETEAYLSEYYMTLQELDETIRHLPKWAKPKNFFLSWTQFFSREKVLRLPYGRVGIASPWNYPFLLAFVPAIGALGAGNRIVLKLSRKAPKTASVVRKIFGKVYSREEVLVYGEKEEDRERFFAEKLDFLFFTGSTEVGRTMAEKAGRELIPYVLELGGKSPVIVTESADISVTARRVLWGKLLNAGQTCIAPDYALVQESIAERFMEELKKSCREFYGEDPIRNSEYPKIIDEKALNRLIDLAKEEGIHSEEAADRKSRKLRPAFFLTNSKSPFMRGEIFGPYLPIIPYRDWEEVPALIDEHPDPLALYLFTRERAKEEDLLRRISFGGGCINDTLIHLSDGRLPFGGVRESGVGRYHGQASFETFSRTTSLVRKSFFPDIPLCYPPFGKVNLPKLLGK